MTARGCQGHAGGLPGQAIDDGAVQVPGQLGQLIRGGDSHRRLAQSELGSHLGGQQLCTILRTARFLAESTKRHPRDVCPALRDPQQAEAGSGWRPSELARR